MELEAEILHAVDVNGYENESCYLCSPLTAAVVAGDLTTVQNLLEHGADKNETDEKGRTAMWHAAYKRHLGIVQLLLEHGADTDKASYDGQTPLYIVSCSGHLPIVQLLVEQGADMEKANSTGDNPLIMASSNGHLEVTRYLLEQGADRDKVGGIGYTALHWAAVFNQVEIAKLLMAYGADLNAKNDQGELPVDIARSHEELRQAILDEPRRRMDEAPGKRAIEQDQHSNAATSASAQQEERGEVAFEEPRNQKPSFEQIETVAAEGMIADEDQDSEPSSDGHGEVDEQNESCHLYSPLITAAGAGDLTTVQNLLERGVDTNEIDEYGCSALWYAAYSGHLGIVQLLLEHGADIDKASYDGQTPLYIASCTGHLPIVQLLAEQGADMEKANSIGENPLINASCNGDIEVARYLLEQGADRDKACNDGYTPLHSAANYGHLEIAKLLMVYGADLNARNRQGALPIDMARNHEEIKQAILDEPRRRMDEAPGKRATEQDRHPNAATSASAQQEEEGEVEFEEPSNQKPSFEQSERIAAEGMVTDEDQDSEPSSDEEDNND